MTPEQTLDWLAEQHKSQCNEDRPVQEWIRSMKSMLPAPVQDVPETDFGNMTKDEALDKALEALEESVDLVREDYENAKKLYGNYPSRQARLLGMEDGLLKHEAAITAIKQARAAPVQELTNLQRHEQNVQKFLAAQEPESFEQWNAKQHGDPEEIGLLQALRIAYMAGQDSVTAPQPAQQEQEPTAKHTDQFESARVGDYNRGWNDCLFASGIVKQPAPVQEPVFKFRECEDSQATTTPPAAQRQWVGLTDEEMLAVVHYSQLDNARAIEAKLKEKNT